MDEDHQPYANPEDEDLSKLERTLKYQVNNPELADCVFLVGEQRTRIYAHKCLLAMSNPVFKSMFYGDLKETKEIEVPDLHEKGFLNLLRYLYTNQIPVDYEIFDLHWSVTAANKYLAFNFIRDFLDIVSCHLEDSSALQIYDQLLKLQLDDESLVKLVEKLIKRAKEMIKGSEQAWDNLTGIDQQTLENILRFDQLYHDEFYLLHNCLRWTDAELKRRGLEATVENKRSLFTSLKHLIRFGDLETYGLARLDIEQYVESDEALSIFLHSANKAKPLLIDYRSPRLSCYRLSAKIDMSYAGLVLPSDSVFETECKFKVNKRAFLDEIETHPILIDCYRSVVCEIFKENKRLGKWKCSYNDYSSEDYEARKTISLRLDHCWQGSTLELEPNVEYRFCFKSTVPLEEPGRLFYGKELTARTDDREFQFTIAGPHHCIAEISFYRTAPLPMD